LLITQINRVCKRFYHLIKHSAVFWTTIDFDVPLEVTNKKQLDYILRHSHKFKIFRIGYASLNVNVADIDILFTHQLCKAKSLCWLDISKCKISTLCFLSNLNNVSIVNISECRNLVDDDFKVLYTCSKVDQLFVSFTKISPATAVELSRHLNLVVYDVCGIKLKIEQCEEILDNSYQTLLMFHISMIGDGIDEQSVDRRLRSVYLETSVYTHRLHQ